MLWYVHPNNTVSLRVAETLADAVLTALSNSFPGSGPRVRVIAHAIDTHRFAGPPLRRHGGTLKLLALGRTSPMKGYPLMVEAVARARSSGTDVKLTVVGPSQTPSQEQHRQELRRLSPCLSPALALR